MKDLILDVHRAVMGRYDRSKPWGVSFVKFEIRFDLRGRVTAITYTPIPEEHEDEVLKRVREACQQHGDQFRGMLAHVVVGFKNPSRN